LAREPGDRYPDVMTFAKELGDALLEAPSASSSSVRTPTPGQAAPATDDGLLSRMKGLFRRG
jgi:hypothetical protein